MMIILIIVKRPFQRSSLLRITKDQAAENRARVVDAAAKLFREKGFEAVGVAELMRAAGMTHGGFYNHFPSKEAVEAAACEQVFAKSVAKLESIAQIDGSVVLDPDSRLLAFGAILRHRQQVAEDEEIGEGGRTAAAIGASQFGNVLMVSEGGQLSFYQKGHCVWTL